MNDFDFAAVLNAIPYLFKTGMAFTVTLTLLAAAMGLALGTVLAMMRLSPFRLLSVPAAIYVNIMRSIPLLLVIFWFYFLMPYVGAWLVGSPRPLQLGAYRSAIITFTMFEAAYFCEIMRAGIQSISRGQIAAAMAIGLTPGQAMRSVVLPQAVRNMVPSLLTRIIILFQDTSLVYVLSLTDFLGAASKIGQRDGRLVELYLFVALVYLIICVTTSQAVKRLEMRTAVVR
ncbi:amino acid ABC transporter permease [Pollutimonas bauzanensis]|uniref:Glutamate/aspartate import permease protein GltK n=1 Tax=Pollutimonas bauzanensis TaxID=658167 RepID=A0A1M5PYN8_9BURK|nr:ABC transporter permease subunit [Pollutimonas bauzanensis]SHH06964.1 glutamate/aspartate transport system permease protein [Pollutimonas bauzanensis]